MSFMSESLSNKKTIELNDLASEVTRLNEEIQICQKEISVYSDAVKEKLEGEPERNKKHTETINAVEQDLNSIKATFNMILKKELPSAENNYQKLSDELAELNTSISIVHRVCEIHERLEALTTLSSNYSDYGQALEVINLLKVIKKTFPSVPGIIFIQELKKMIENGIENTTNLFIRQFEENCVFVSDESSFIMKVPAKTELLSCLLPVLYKSRSTCELLISLSKSILEKLFLSVIKNSCQVSLESVDNFKVIKINIIDTNIDNDYKNVCQNMILITEYLVKYLDCCIDDDLKLVKYVGSFIKTSLAENMFQKYIMKLIPNDWSSLEKFKFDLLTSMENLKEKLEPHGLFDRELWEKVCKIDEYYGDQRCLYYEYEARMIMQKDLHTMIEVQSSSDLKDQATRYSISANIPELIKLGRNLLDEISDGPSQNRKILFVTYKGIFFNYADYVAAHHQKLLETIPQQVALFYNNCQYLFLQLKDWDEMFETNPIFQELLDDSVKAFYQVEEVGRIFFNSFVDDQKQQIDIILRGTNLQSEKTLEKLDDKTEKLVRQCLRQQELLKTVWSKVLSYPVYHETIGDIFNSMCSFLINSLVKVEDISAVVAEHLIEIFKIVLNRGPKLFIDSNEISLYVSQWHKFNEVIFVLGSSLVEINDRWSDGKGPLALHFNPYELKQLIRALFQNSERRAAVLAKIHE